MISMKKILEEKLFFVPIVIALVVSVGLFVFYRKDIAKAFSIPPPSAHSYLYNFPPSVSKNLCSLASQSRLGSSCMPASSFSADSFPVNRGEKLKIRVRYQPPSRVEDDFPKLVEIRETLPVGGYLRYIGSNMIQGEKYDGQQSNLPSSGELIVANNRKLVYRFGNYRPEDAVELEIVLEAVEYTTDGPIKVDQSPSYVRYNQRGNNRIDLDPANIVITDIIGPRGDIYSHGSIDNSSRNVLGTDLDQIDVIGSGGAINGFGDNPDWQISNYQAKIGDESYRDSKYYDYYKAKLNKRLELIVNEAEVQDGNQSNITSDQYGYVYYKNGLNLSNKKLSFSKSKTIIVKGDIKLTNVDIVFSGSDVGLAFVSVGGSIELENTKNRLVYAQAHFSAIDDKIIVDNRGGGHLIVKGSLSSKSFELAGDNYVSYIYDSSGLLSIPGLAKLYDPKPYEHYY